MDFSNNHQYSGGDDDRSMGSRAMSSIGMASSAKAHNDESFMTNSQFNAAKQDGSTATNTNETLDVKTAEDALTAEAENAVTKERQMIYKENAAKLQSILENIKNATKNVLREMEVYLEETEEVEKTFIRCRANTQKESQRMEQVEPDVNAATQRFMAQAGQQLFGAGGSMNLMNMAALMNGAGSTGTASLGGMPGVNGTGSGGSAVPMMMATVTPRGDDCSSMAASSMAGSMH